MTQRPHLHHLYLLYSRATAPNTAPKIPPTGTAAAPNIAWAPALLELELALVVAALTLLVLVAEEVICIEELELDPVCDEETMVVVATTTPEVEVWLVVEVMVVVPLLAIVVRPADTE